MQTLIEFLICLIFSHADFFKDVFIAVLGVVLGAILTAIINNHAVRTQAKFNMEYEMLKEYHQKVQGFCCDIEEIEILLAMAKWETASLADRIYALDSAMGHFCIRVDEERKYVRKYLSAKSVQKFINNVTLFHESLFTKAIDTNSGMPTFELLKTVNSEHIDTLYKLEKKMQKTCVCFSDSMERILSPGFFGWLKRKFRKPMMAISKCLAIATDNEKDCHDDK